MHLLVLLTCLSTSRECDELSNPVTTEERLKYFEDTSGYLDGREYNLWLAVWPEMGMPHATRCMPLSSAIKNASRAYAFNLRHASFSGCRRTWLCIQRCCHHLLVH